MTTQCHDPIPHHTREYIEAVVADQLSTSETLTVGEMVSTISLSLQDVNLARGLLDAMVSRGVLIRTGVHIRLRPDLVSPARIPAVGTQSGTQVRAVARAMVRVGPMTREEVQEVARISCPTGRSGNLSWLTTFSGGLTAETRLWFPVDVTRDVRGADGSVRVKRGKQVLVPGRQLLSVVQRLEDVSREVPDRERDSLLQRIAVDNDFDLCGRIDVRPEDGWTQGSFLLRERYRF